MTFNTHYLDENDSEIPVVVSFDYTPAVRDTRTCPGNEASIEITEVIEPHPFYPGIRPDILYRVSGENMERLTEACWDEVARVKESIEAQREDAAEAAAEGRAQ